MDHRRLGKVARDNGGFLVIAAGAVWEGVEVSHTLKYLRELIEHLDLKGIVAHWWHPSALSVIAIGFAWSLGVHLWRRLKERRESRPAGEKLPPEITVVENTHLESTNVAEIARSLKAGDSCEITEEVTRKRTIVVRAGH